MAVGAQEDRADELGDLVNVHPERVSEALPELEAILRNPDDHYALAEVIIALGLAWDARATNLLVNLVTATHPEEQVRLALAQALPGGSSTEPVRSAAINLLTQLSGDAAEDVRDWACFGLGQLNADGNDVQNALAARLNDDHVDTRCEALLALAKTGDPRAVAATIEQLSSPDPDDIHLLELAAATELADPALLPALARLERAWAGDDDDDHTKALAYAVRRCQPEQLRRAAHNERKFIATVNRLLYAEGSERSITLTEQYPRTKLTLNGSDGMTDHDFGPFRVWEDLAPSGTTGDDLGVENWVHTIISHDKRRASTSDIDPFSRPPFPNLAAIRREVCRRRACPTNQHPRCPDRGR